VRRRANRRSIRRRLLNLGASNRSTSFAGLQRRGATLTALTALQAAGRHAATAISDPVPAWAQQATTTVAAAPAPSWAQAPTMNIAPVRMTTFRAAPKAAPKTPTNRSVRRVASSLSKLTQARARAAVQGKRVDPGMISSTAVSVKQLVEYIKTTFGSFANAPRQAPPGVNQTAWEAALYQLSQYPTIVQAAEAAPGEMTTEIEIVETGPTMDVLPGEETFADEGMSTGKKIAIGAGALLAIAVGYSLLS